MRQRDTFELIQELEGEIDPCGDSEIDIGRLSNLKTWCQIHSQIINAIIDCADYGDLRDFYNAEKIISYARSHLRDMFDKLDNIIQSWDIEEAKDKSEDNYFF